MDSDLVRTFLEVHRTRHFARAAERLFVTPAAVSARVRLLEQQLGTRLFIRNRNNIRLTAAGQRLLPHAENILRSWNRALLSVGTSDEYREPLALGSLQSIWSELLGGWLPDLYDQRPELMLQLELLTSLALVTRVREQSLDLALVYEPPQVSDLVAEPVASVELMLVSSTQGVGAAGDISGYVHVDWGMPYSMTLARDLAQLPDPALRVDSCEVALEFLRTRGGAAYLPRQSVLKDLDAGQLYTVEGAPLIERRVYLIQGANSAPSSVREAVSAHLRGWLAPRS